MTLDEWRERCDNCFWGASCFRRGACEYYYPLSEKKYEGVRIERERMRFYEEWWEYVHEDFE